MYELRGTTIYSEGKMLTQSEVLHLLNSKTRLLVAIKHKVGCISDSLSRLQIPGSTLEEGDMVKVSDPFCESSLSSDTLSRLRAESRILTVKSISHTPGYTYAYLTVEGVTAKIATEGLEYVGKNKLTGGDPHV